MIGHGCYWCGFEGEGPAIMSYQIQDINGSVIASGGYAFRDGGEIQSIAIGSPTYSISKAIFFPDEDSTMSLDNFQYNLVPEPVSMILLVVGGVTLIIRRYWKRK